MELRGYQSTIVERIMNSEFNRQLVSLPTGTGKTYIFCELARRLDRPTLILAHRNELINQAVEKMLIVWPDADIGIVKAERNEVDRQITIASVQTLANEKRLKQLRSDIGLIITDEAHHAVAASYRKIYDHYKVVTSPQLLHVGVTATPLRDDKLGLKDIYDDVTFSGQYTWFVKKQYLCDIALEGINCSLDLHGIKTKRGEYGLDYDIHSLSSIVNTDITKSAIFDAYIRHAKDRKHTVGFAVNCEHGQQLTTAFNEGGVPCRYLDGETPPDERKQILSDFQAGYFNMLWNVLVLTEGYDQPNIDCILIARPSQSAGLLTQMVGRGTRMVEGKSNLLVLDIAHSHRVKKDVEGEPIYENGQIAHAGSLTDIASIFNPPIQDLPHSEFARGTAPDVYLLALKDVLLIAIKDSGIVLGVSESDLDIFLDELRPALETRIVSPAGLRNLIDLMSAFFDKLGVKGDAWIESYVELVKPIEVSDKPGGYKPPQEYFAGEEISIASVLAFLDELRNKGQYGQMPSDRQLGYLTHLLKKHDINIEDLDLSDLTMASISKLIRKLDPTELPTKNACPKCGEYKKAEYPVCYECHRSNRRRNWRS